MSYSLGFILTRISKKLARLSLMTLFLFLSLTSFAQDAIKDIRFWHAPDKTRMVIDLTDGVGYKVFSLNNPNRLVVDLQNTKPPNALEPVNNKLIQGMRIATRQKNDTRIVLDLRHSIKMEHFALGPRKPYGHRIVVDMFVPKTLMPDEDPVLAIIQKRLFEDRKAKQSQLQGEPDDSNETAPTTPEQNQTQAEKDQTQVEKNTVTEPSLVKKPELLTNRDVIIAIDAGHGGEDPGAIGQGKTKEKHVVMSISKKLHTMLNQQPGVTAVLTRKSDYFVSLTQRVRLSRQKYAADFFVSVHADSARRKSARGASVYVLGKSGVNRTLALYLSQQEAAGEELQADKEQLSSLNKVLADLSLSGSMSHSVLAAEKVLEELGKVSQMHSRKVKYNNFQVLRNPYMPAILVETGFISNRKDEQLLQNRRHKDKLTQAIGAGIIRYFKTQPPPGTYFASLRNNPVIIHVVKRNEFLSTLAKKYNTTTAAIKKSNGLKSDSIRVGQKLTITQGRQ